MTNPSDLVAVCVVGYRCEDAIAKLIAASREWGHQAFDIHVCENGGHAAFLELAAALAAIAEPDGREGAERSYARVVGLRRYRLPGDQRVVLYEAGENVGYAGGVNVLLAILRADPGWSAIWLLNPDTHPRPEALTSLLRYQRGGSYGIVGARLVLADTHRVQQYGGRWRWLLAHGFNIGFGAPSDARPDTPRIESELDYVSGACMLVARAFVEAVGEMDERYFLYSEEVDWCLRKGTYRLGYDHEAVVYHDQGITTGSNMAMRNRSLFSIYLMERSGILLTWKFRPLLVPAAALGSAIYTLKYLKAGGVKPFRSALSGCIAGLFCETGRPKRFPG